MEEEKLRNLLDKARRRGPIRLPEPVGVEEGAELRRRLQEAEERANCAELRAAELEEQLRRFEDGALTHASDASEAAAPLQEIVERARKAEALVNQLELELKRSSDRLAQVEKQIQEAHRETQRLAFQDPLTGLANLNLMQQYLDFTVRQVQRYQRNAALLSIDLDHFKVINDAMGLRAGDELLVRVAERIQAAIRDSDALARRGEDEFLVLLSEVNPTEQDPRRSTQPLSQEIVEAVTTRILADLSRAFLVQAQTVYVQCSIGVSLCPGDAQNSQEFLEHSHAALAHAKMVSRGSYQFFTPNLRQEQQQRLLFDAQMRQALEKGEFQLEYQPVVEMSKGRARLIGAEALLRWHHRLEGRLKPERFLRVAEETGMIVPLGHWIIHQVCRQLRIWKESGWTLFATINLSPRQILQANLAEAIQAAVTETGAPARSLFMEVSVGLNALNAEVLDRFMHRLEEAGIGLALDDFGTGLYSLNRLSEGPARILKIAPFLVAGCSEEKGQNVCAATIALAHGLGLTPLAKGVENSIQATFLAKNGCRYAQGYHFSPPLTPEDFDKLLIRNHTWRL
ncbi:MAG: EAL domain-containing protein [Armatimonadetes bacterium]|nr:EAL domain-containing protein [Armatimonadota bacterium]